MDKLKIRGCSHCRNGEVFIDHDEYGWYESCLQCGYSRDLPDMASPAAGEWKRREKISVPVKRAGRLSR